jgi:carboxymethylenebutenolidase
VRLESGFASIDGPGGRLPAYLTHPAAAELPLPGLLVVHEAWGVDDHMEDVADRLATAGYVVIAPDLFARGGERPEVLEKERLGAAKRFVDEAGPQVMRDPLARDAALLRRAEPDRTNLRDTLTLLSSVLGQSEKLVDLAQAALAHLRAGPSRGERVGALGFCMGGGLVGLLAVTDPALAAVAAFYGMPPPAGKLRALEAAFVGFYGGPEKDPSITSTVPAFETAAREANKRVHCHVYEDAPHAFMNDTRPSYRVAAARDAWARTLGLFASELVPKR